MAHAPTAEGSEFEDTLDAALQLALQANTRRTVQARVALFNHWRKFAGKLQVPPDLRTVEPSNWLSFLLIFGMAYR